MNRTRRTILSFLSSLLFFFTTSLIGLLGTPLLIKWLGTETFGATLALQNLLSIICIAESAVFGALLPLFSRACSDEDVINQKMILAQGFRAYAYLTVMGIVLGTILFPLLPYLIRIEEVSERSLTLAYFSGLLGLSFLVFRPAQAWCSASQRGYWLSFSNMLQGFMVTAACLTAAYFDTGILGQIVTSQIVTGITMGMFFLVVLKYLGMATWKIVFCRVDTKVCREFWNQSRYVFLMGVFGQLSLWMDNIIIASILGADIVTPFYITQRLGNFVYSALISASNAVWPSLADLYNRGEREIFNERLCEATRLIAIMGMSVMVPCIVCNRSFVTLWMGEANYAGDLLTGCCCFNMIAQGIFVAWGMSLQSTGRIKVMIPIFAIQTVVNIIASLLLTWIVGVEGPVIGTSIAFLLITLWGMLGVLKSEFSISPFLMLRAIAAPIALGCATTALGYLTIRIWTPSSWVTLIVLLATLSAVYFALAWGLILGRSERERLIDILIRRGM